MSNLKLQRARLDGEQAIALTGGEVAHLPPFRMASSRLAGLDAIRGLMLTIVLADHCGGMLTEGRFIRQWTLMGLGWSDSAEVLVSVR